MMKNVHGRFAISENIISDLIKVSAEYGNAYESYREAWIGDEPSSRPDPLESLAHFLVTEQVVGRCNRFSEIFSIIERAAGNFTCTESVKIFLGALGRSARHEFLDPMVFERWMGSATVEIFASNPNGDRMIDNLGSFESDNDSQQIAFGI